MSNADLLVKAVRSWIRTPYRPRAMVKGSGVDCLKLLIGAHLDAGLIDKDIETGIYSTDWFLHRGEEVYLGGVEQYLSKLDTRNLTVEQRLAKRGGYTAPSGTVIMFRIGRTFSHAGIITHWPFMVHASQPAGMVEEIDITKDLRLSSRLAKTYIHRSLLP